MCKAYTRIGILVLLAGLILNLLAGCAATQTTAPHAHPMATAVPPTATPRATGATVAQSPTSEAAPEESAPAPALSGDDGDGLIAFVSTRDGNGEIYVMNVADALQGTDDGDPRRLTNHPLWDGFPDWSPDGQQLVYYSYLDNRNWVIKVMDLDGSNARQLTAGGACDGAPHWSPDGTWIAYASAADCSAEHREVYVMMADGSEPRNLTRNPADDVGSSWSPDSQQIAFASNRDGNYEIYVMDADGSDVRCLTNDAAADYAPAWSPDGTQIAFYSDRDGNDEIHVMDADGGHPRNLTNNPTEDWFPRWSPDGSQITFSSRRDGNLDIYVMNADGSDVRRLTHSPREDFNSVWQPLPADEQSAIWIRSYEDEASGTALDGVLTEDGGYLFVGSTHYTHRNRDDEDIYLMETDAAGELGWEKALGGDRFDRGNRIIPAADGGFLILGETRSFGAGDRDVYLLKIDVDGEELWSQVYGGPEEEKVFDIRLTADGGYILAGQTASFGAGGSDVYLIKTDAQGNQEWSRTFGGAWDEEGYAAVELPGGGFLVLGVALHEGADYVAMDPDIYLIRTGESGEELWSQVREEPGVQSGHAMLATSHGHYLITGLFSAGERSSGIDSLVLKIDGDGNTIWEQVVGEADIVDYGTDAVETSDGGYLLTGMSTRSHGGIPLIKVDQSGRVLWREYLSEARGNRAGLGILESPAGGYLVIGTVSDGREGWYTLLIGIDAGGKTDVPSPAPAAPLEGSARSLVLLGNLIDGTGAETLRDAALVIQGERIVAVGPRGQGEIPPDAEVINPPGATILPGLINTHVHNAYKVSNLKTWAAAGVTTVRDLGAPYGGNYLVRRDRLGDDPQRARLIVAGPLVTVPDGYPIAGNDFPSLTVTSPEDAREKINQLIEDGADVIKITLTSGSAPSLSPEEAAAIVETAHARGIPVTAHATTAEDLKRALDAGVDDVAHMATDRVSDRLIRRTVAADVSWVPTLAVLQGRGAGNLRRFLDAGGRVALGNDAGYLDGVEIGLPVNELEHLEKAGMTPMEIVVAATRNAAYVCRLEDQLGTLEAGKIADVLVVAGDPLQDMEALKDVLLVIHQGVIIRREE